MTDKLDPNQMHGGFPDLSEAPELDEKEFPHLRFIKTDIDYKFNEKELIAELQRYVDSTYGQHYSKNKFQTAEFVIDCGHGMGFFLGNVLKYTQRYGHKDGTNRADLMKVLHYALLALHTHDEEEKAIPVEHHPV
jgi:hypothetical protein